MELPAPDISAFGQVHIADLKHVRPIFDVIFWSQHLLFYTWTNTSLISEKINLSDTAFVI
jgi:hypothetical protein